MGTNSVLGAAQSIVYVYNPALKVIDWWTKYKLNGASFITLTDDDNLQQILTKSVHFLLHNNIPHHLNHNNSILESTQSTTKYLTP